MRRSIFPEKPNRGAAPAQASAQAFATWSSIFNSTFNMEWLEVSVEVEKEIAEAVAEALSRYAYHGVAIEAGPGGWNAGPVAVRAYLPADDDLWANKQRVEEALWHLSQIEPIPEPTFQPIKEEDWTEAWKEQLELLRIGQRVVIQPSWLDYSPKPEDVVIQLDPGMAFGTGLHPTTQMCLEALEELIQPGSDVLDLGTGSGILALAAAKLGAGSVLAVDTDRQAVRTARRTVSANGVDDIVKVKDGSLPEIEGHYDLALVNILAKVIIEMFEAGLAKRMRPGGVVVAAGITAEQRPEVIEALKKEETLTLVGCREKGSWVNVLARRT